MHNRYLCAVLWAVCGMGLTWASSALAQAAPPSAPPSAAPAPAPLTAAPAEPAPPLVPPQAGTQPPQPAAAAPTAPAEVVPPAPPPPPPAGEPRPPQSSQLGGQAEFETEPGTWNPWDHGDVGDNYTHEGFFLRLQLGPGGSSVTREGESWSGFGLGLGLAIGFSPVENLALHLDLQTTWMFSPDNQVNGIGLQSNGLGVTYYIVPINIYLSGSAGIGWLTFENGTGQSRDTSFGFALDVLVGKEWWVGADWGIGVAAQLLYMHVQDYTDDAGMDAVAGNLLFTATYN